MKSIFQNSRNKKIMLIIWAVFWLILIVLAAIFATKSYLEYQNTKRIEKISNILGNTNVDRNQCTNIFSVDTDTLFLDSEKNKLQEFEEKKLACHTKYDIAYTNLDKYTCLDIIAEPKQNLYSKYLILDNLAETKKYCINSFFPVKISQGKVFDELNGFRSQIIFDFDYEFYRDIWVVNGENFIENRLEAKKLFLQILETSQNISITLDDITLYSKRAIVSLDLLPEQTYSFNIKTLDIKENALKNNNLYYSGETKIKSTDNPNIQNNLAERFPALSREIFEITLPENKFLGLIIKDPVSLYPDTNQPVFKLMDYNSGKQNISAKICRVPNEVYAKIEIMDEQKNNLFFQKGIDDLKTLDCYTKEISIENKTDDILHVQEFNFAQQIGEIARSGLYYVTFENPENRFFNQRYQRPLFFGIVDSHITMKISKNGEAFFFVNDLKWNPLAEQNIRIWVNNFEAFWETKNWNNQNPKLTSPLEVDIFAQAQLLWETNQDGVLQVNLNDFIQDGYQKTFWDWYSENYKWKFDSFMVTSSSETNLSYSNSRFNSGIAPWNFGYSIDQWYYFNGSSDENEIKLSQNTQKDKSFYAHIFPERRLYLPGETTFIKAILRKTSDLSIPEETQATIKIFNYKNEEIYSTGAVLDEFWSASISYDFSKDAALWSYRAKVYVEDEYIAETWMSVEVFQKPKFKNDVMLETIWLDEGFVEVIDIQKENISGWESEKYLGNFQIKAKVLSQYYNGRMLQNANFTYKIYKQDYYPNSYWSDCYYGCYWEPNKEFYTEWTGSLNIDGQAEFLVDIDFDSRYADYKYIVEVSVEDTNWDIISGTNSILALLPEKYKKYNWDSRLIFSSDTKFIEAGQSIQLTWGLNAGKWSKSYDNTGLLVVKKKDYSVEYREDIRGKIPKNTVIETIVDIISINDSDFKKTKDGKLTLDYKLNKTWEYIFEYWMIGLEYPLSQIFDTAENRQEILEDISKKFISKKSEEIIYNYNSQDIIISLDDFIVGNNNYFSTVVYWDSSAKNPEFHDNKLQVMSEKVSYKPWETAKILVRLPFENSKILWTIEKQGVVEHEYIDVPWNIFFKEIVVDETFEPNAYIWVLMVDTRENVAPEYKVGYTEIVVDKSEKVSNISIQTNKQNYIPRENVEINLEVRDKNNNPKKSQITLMVVDDSLISLLGNIDVNILEKIYKKLPFQIQTQLSSVAMIQNFYFSRKWIVGWSWLGSFKGWDSAVSTRNIFKNTAFYDANIITDENGKAQINFELPDNITNFRIIALTQSKDNYFGNSQEFISVRKNILIEEKMPLISRTKDEIIVGANIFNLTEKSQTLDVSFEAQGVEVQNETQKIELEKNGKQFVTWRIKNISNPQNINYSITAQWKNIVMSDKIEKSIPVYSSPVLYSRERKTTVVAAGWIYEYEFELPKNIDKQNSFVELVFSNNRLNGLEKSLQTLLIYPYGCIEQTVSSTYPNAVAKKLNSLLSGDLDTATIDKNISSGLERIFSMQNADGWFSYWYGDNESNLTITPYVLRSLLDMRDLWVEIEQYKIDDIIKYISQNIENLKDNTQKAEVLWALAQAGKYVNIDIDTSKFDRHELIAYTYALYHVDFEKYEDKISNNIMKIESMLENDSSKYYWNAITDKALFTQLIIDVDFDETVIENKIADLYDYDFESFYYSTNTKNAAFTAFAKYIEYTWTQKSNSFGFSLGKIQNRGEVFSESWDNQAVITKKYTLEEMLYDDWEIDLKVANLRWDKMYVDFVFHKVPKNKEDIPAYSNDMEISRTHFLVNDETKLGSCSQKYYFFNEQKPNCQWVFSEITDGKYQKDKIYKSEIRIKLPKDKRHSDLVVEEFLASGFEIIQWNFRTQSVAVGQADKNISWVWSYTQNLPDRAMAHAKYVYDEELVYEFYFRPKYEWNFTLPPVTGYLMYQPETRAHSKFSNVEVK